MQYKIQNGVVELSGQPILKQIDFEINDNSKIAVVGRNGCGKTTLLKLISGEYSIVKKDSDTQSFIAVSSNVSIGFLSQMTFEDDNRTLLEEVRSAYREILDLKEKVHIAENKMRESGDENDIKEYTNLLDTLTNLGGFYFEKEYEAAIKKFGFSEEEKHRKLYEFSGGQRTKIAFLKLLLSKPDILLLDEPTNHLDVEAVVWLEEYLKNYKKAFVVVSHDRMFLDNVATTVYEIENGKTHKYVGNYTRFAELKKERRALQLKEYEAQQKDIARLEGLVDRFRYKATKASMAQSKIKELERMELVDAPEREDLSVFHFDLTPIDIGVKDVLSVKDLKIGYDSILSTVSLEMKRGDKVGIIGGNGLGKSTFIKTLVGEAKKLGGEIKFGPRVSIGYFDQQMAQYSSKDTVLDDFLKVYPSLTPFEARCALGAFLFSGEDVFKTVDMLSGGERVRLALCKIFKKRPNFLILDEPTNHMDIASKEALEEMLQNFQGTLLFVSHDRYFIKEISNSLLHFDKDKVTHFPYGYSQYLSSPKTENVPEVIASQPREKKTYTTPLKEKAKKEKAIKKCEEKIAKLEEELALIENELLKEENISDYVKLGELNTRQAEIEQELLIAMEEWENLFD